MAADATNGGDAQPGRTSVAGRLAGATGLERAVASVVEETIVRTVESEAVIKALERIIEDGRLQAAVERSIDQKQLEEAIKRALDSEVADRVWEDILASDKAQMLVERVAEAPEVRAAIAQQGFGLITDIGRQVSKLTEALDDGAERVAHAVVRRGDHEAETNEAGLVTRLAAFAIDAGLMVGFLTIVSGLFSSIIPTILGNGDENGVSTGALIAIIAAGLLFAGGVFVAFWNLIGQTPGMRFLGIRLLYHGERDIPYWVAFKRAWAIPLSVIPFLLGFLAILVSPRRLAWHDHIAGTEVIYDEASAPWSLAPREWVHSEAEDSKRPGRPGRA